MIEQYIRVIKNIEENSYHSDTRSILIEVLQRMITNPEEFNAVRQPLGFIYVKLFETDNKTLRFHIWLNKDKSQLLTSPIHDHIWHLTSYVLYGTVVNYTVECDFDSSTPKNRIYEVVYDKLNNTLVPTSSLVEYKIRKKERFDAGHIYTIEPRTFHFTDISSEVAATVVVAKNTNYDKPRSLGEIESKVHIMSRAQCLPNEIKSGAQIIMSKLNVEN